jgi:AmiR/NasT family two-component response regulator
MSATPNFAGGRAVILHRAGDTTDILARQLGLLGLKTSIRWRPLDSAADVDMILVDADEGWDGLLPWRPETKPVPLIALLASEAPGRIAWALDQGADALIAKPVAASAVFPALVMAARRHGEARDAAERVAEMQERLRLRPLVLAAVQQLMAARTWTEEEAHRDLRRQAMRRRITLEEAAARVLSDAPRRAG